MLSTMQSQPEIESTSDQKPSIILFYNKTKGDVDTLDRMLRSYSIKCMTRRWPLVLFYNIWLMVVQSMRLSFGKE